jgi:hypothetical protein
MLERVNRNGPGRVAGAAGFENGGDVLSPIQLVDRSDQEMSRDADRCRCRGRAMTAALHGEEPGDPGAMNAAEPVRGASPHRVPDEKNRDARQLRMLALRAEVGECLKQGVMACGVVFQGRRSNERHGAAGKLQCATPYLPFLARRTPDAASARGTGHESARVQRETGGRVSQARQENDCRPVLGDACGQEGDSVPGREQLASVNRGRTRRRRHGRRSRPRRDTARSARGPSARNKAQRQQRDGPLHQQSDRDPGRSDVPDRSPSRVCGTHGNVGGDPSQDSHAFPSPAAQWHLNVGNPWQRHGTSVGGSGPTRLRAVPASLQPPTE